MHGRERLGLIAVGLALASCGGAEEWSWTSIGPPASGAVSIIAVAPSAHGTIFALAGSEVVKTTNGGSTWTTVDFGQPLREPVSAIGIDPFLPSIVYVGTGDRFAPSPSEGAMYKSRDGGQTWSRLSRFPGVAVSAPQIVVSPSRSVFVGTVRGIYGSFDDGATWTVVGANESFVWSLEFTSGIPTVAYAAADGIYKSTDGGGRWFRLATPSGYEFFVLVAADPRDPSTAYAIAICPPCPLAPGGAVFVRTTDGGTNWGSLAFPLFARPSLSDFVVGPDSSVYVAAADFGVFRSVDRGATWFSTGAGLTDVSVLTLGSDETALYAGTSGGLFKALPVTACASSSIALCLSSARFQFEVVWSASNIGQSGAGQTMPLTADSGAFWFFQPSNIEIVVKVLDGRTINGHFWVFYGALTNVGYTITVTDTLTGAVQTYDNAEGQLASGADTEAF